MQLGRTLVLKFIRTEMQSHLMAQIMVHYQHAEKYLRLAQVVVPVDILLVAEKRSQQQRVIQERLDLARQEQLAAEEVVVLAQQV
jgi:hypothetical protein